jgi:hypothetical protein
MKRPRKHGKLKLMSTKSDNGKPEMISPELLLLIQSLNGKLQLAKVSYETVINEVSQQYKLAEGDSVDLATGVIKRKAKIEAVA